MQSKKILLSSILCSSLVAGFAFADTNANAQASQNAQNSVNFADGGGGI